MRKRLIPVLIIMLGIAGFVALKATRDVPDPVSPQERSWRVEVMEIQPEALQPSLTLYGQLESPRRFTVVAPMAGRIGELPVRDGQQVEQGSLLVALDEDDILPRVKQAEADLADAQAQLLSEQLNHRNDQQALALEKRILANAETSFKRTEQLVGRELVSRAELDNAQDIVERAALTVATRRRSIDSHESRLAALQARAERAEAALESMQRDAERSRFMAPFAGVVGSVQVAEGDQVNANAALLDFYPVEGMELRASLPQIHGPEFIRALAAGQQLVAHTLETRSPLSMTLQRIAGQADASGVEALFTLDQPVAGLRVGNLLAISVPKPASENSVALPYSALYGNNTVYALVDGRMSRIEVERVGETRQEGGQRWILVQSEELKAGMRIITTHLPNALQGLRVETAEGNAVGTAPESMTERAE
ncbi:efflux RND transporter periplasmic adaptor subunit [Halopseudomonas sp.]|jgi:HlyD family secretion protein|uniref:efflux RND transporter periplasmic adaptor subunit n=1 Tax=Halopseudomonas sp. TaxID=2901191 RepID=UPI0039E4FD67